MDKHEAAEVAGALRVAIGLLVRRLRQKPEDGGLTLPEATALTFLDREGPMTSAALARREQITPQSMGATVSALEDRGLVRRATDPKDGRKSLITLTRSGRDVVQRRRDATVQALAQILSSTFSAHELVQLRAAAGLIERLAKRL